MQQDKKSHFVKSLHNYTKCTGKGFRKQNPFNVPEKTNSDLELVNDQVLGFAPEAGYSSNSDSPRRRILKGDLLQVNTNENIKVTREKFFQRRKQLISQYQVEEKSPYVQPIKFNFNVK